MSLTVNELRQMALEIEADLMKKGDPMDGDDWQVMQVVRAYLKDHPAPVEVKNMANPIDVNILREPEWPPIKEAGAFLLPPHEPVRFMMRPPEPAETGCRIVVRMDAGKITVMASMTPAAILHLANEVKRGLYERVGNNPDDS